MIEIRNHWYYKLMQPDFSVNTIITSELLGVNLLIVYKNYGIPSSKSTNRRVQSFVIFSFLQSFDRLV